MSKVQEILDNIPEDRKEAVTKLHQTIVSNLPEGFEPGISYGMLGYVIPHHLYPAGYHCKPSEPLPFASIASQKNSINFYHMGIYADQNLWSGLLQNSRNIALKSSTWVKAVCASKSGMKSPLSSWVNSCKK